MLEWLKKKFNPNEETEDKEESLTEELENTEETEELESVEEDFQVEFIEDKELTDEEIEGGEKTLPDNEAVTEAPKDEVVTKKYSFDRREPTDEPKEGQPIQETEVVSEESHLQEDDDVTDEDQTVFEEIEEVENIEDDDVDEIDDVEVEESFDEPDFIETDEIEPEEASQDEVEEDEVEEEKIGWFGRLKAGLSKTRDNMNYKINDILGNYVKIDEDMIEDLEDLLISSDIGMETTMTLIDNLRDSIREKQIQDPNEVKPVLAEEIRKILEKNGDVSRLNLEPSPAVILIVGVNGVGKTTTIGKLAHKLKSEGKSVLIAAADTFRAAAIEQVETWGERSGVTVISHKEGADPAAVVFDAIQAQKARNIDVLICDTAGRLHNKKNLMNELEKIHRIIEKESPNAQKESLLVLDATTGQNAILQAKSFDEVTHLTGIVLTKLDGTAKGGVVLPLIQELDIPIKLIGVGEGMNDLQEFSGEEFADALVNG
ncbi:signal recognition particle-docking protein FtsY [Aedoeadaptatus coxii]|uniref:signal recognition particle-docking protein FtsY n=1 Tax=Aedoeadaptatus coxii TaxID=755172 RepID=UPI00175C2688|nr:signal recognition particle-docking protein FtsY [Peptoniphilus coxii]CAC9930545.1 signal recognition particle-docking protein FtsY [Peptoniphilus coxii]